MYQLPDPSVLPTRQFSITVELPAPIADCFRAASAEDAMMRWVPMPKSIVYDHSAAREPYGAGSWRLVTLTTGVSLVEVIFLSEAPRLCGYFLPHFGLGVDLFIRNYQGRMAFEPIDAKRTRLVWTGYFDCSGWQKLTEPLFRVMLRTLVGSMATKMQRYLANG